MIGLQSNFGPSLVLAAVVALSTSLAALVVAWRRHAAGDPWQAPAARVFAIGAIIVVIAATALRRRFGIDTDGDLVLRLGRAGLADWRVAFRDPGSLPAIQLFSNVLLHAPVGFGLVLGWRRLRHLTVPIICLGLSIAIETIQFFALGRVAATDDVVLNVSGAMIGWLAARLLSRRFDFTRA